VYWWHDGILVIGYFKPRAHFERVQLGEAILHADKQLVYYIEVNKIAKLRKRIKTSGTSMIPFHVKDQPVWLHFDHSKKKWQYMVRYGTIVNNYVTREIGKLLPLLFFQDEANSSEMAAND
jgi:hypothetical protein